VYDAKLDPDMRIRLYKDGVPYYATPAYTGTFNSAATAELQNDSNFVIHDANPKGGQAFWSAFGGSVIPST
jgi:hypothetical protein